MHVTVRYNGLTGFYLGATALIVLVRLKVEVAWVSLIQVYAPTEDRSQDVKDEFYAKLQDTVGGVARIQGTC